MNLIKELHRGLIKENAVFVLLLGMCPTLAVTGSAMNGLGMGLASTAVLIGSNMVIALLKNVIPDKVRIPVFIVVIASFVTIIDLTMGAYTPELHEELGIFIPLIVVNCVILGRAEAFASRNSFLDSLVDAIVMGIGFTFALTLLGSVREILGSGAIFGWKFVSEDASTILLFILQPGAFIALGFLIAIVNRLTKKRTPPASEDKNLARPEAATKPTPPLRGTSPVEGNPEHFLVSSLKVLSAHSPLERGGPPQAGRGVLKSSQKNKIFTHSSIER